MLNQGNINSQAAADSLDFQIAQDVRNVLTTDVLQFQPGSTNRWIHDHLSKLGAIKPDPQYPIPPGEQRKALALAKVEAELVPCLESIVELMEKDTSKDRMDIITAELKSYVNAGSEAERYKHFIKASNTGLDLLHSHTIHESTAVPFEDPTSVLFMRHDPAYIGSFHNGKPHYRKPDIVLAYRQHIQALHPEPLTSKELLEKVTDRPPKSLAWTEGLLFVEKKLGSKNISKPVERYTANTSPEVNIVNREALRAEIQAFSIGLAKAKEEKEASPSTVPTSSKAGAGNHQVDSKEGVGNKRGASAAGLDYSSAEQKKAKKQLKVLEKQLKSMDSLKQTVEYDDLRTQHPVVQLADYAAEALFNTFGRNHALGLMINGSKLNLWRFDHECPIQMAGFDFIKDLPTFFMFLFVLQRLKPADWGYLPHFGDVNRRDITPLEAEKLATEAAEKVRDETGREVPKDFIETRAKEIIKQDSIRTIDLSDMVITGKAAGATATFKGKKDDAIPTRFGLNGRSTGVKRGELSISVDEDGKKKPDQAVALKLSWAEINRTREKAIVDRARKAFEGKKFREGGDPSDYLPEILGEKVFAEFDTDIVRLAVLQNYEAERAKRPLAKRCPVLVLMPKYEPISFITSLSEATRVSLFIALIYCHAMLWSIGIEHGDISEGNLMYEESTYRPKLCDYDLAHIRGRDRPSGHSNTGTWAFMASDLLTLDAMDGKVRRLYRHDFESFIAVLVWVFLRYDKEKRIPNSLVDCWVQDDFDRCLTNRGRTYNLIEHGKITRPEWLTKVMWLELKSLVITFNNILTARRTAERELSGLETRRTRAGVDTSGLSTGGSKNGGAFFAPREDNTTTLWSKEDEEMLASLKRDIEEYDDLRFAKMAFSTIPLFRLGTSLGPYFDKEMKEHLKVTEDQATNVPT